MNIDMAFILADAQTVEAIQRRVDRAMARLRKDTIEECARAAEMKCDCKHNIAEAIRKLSLLNPTK